MDIGKKIFAFDFDGVIADSFGFHLARLREYTGEKITEEGYRDMSLGNFYQSQWNQKNREKMRGYGEFISKKMEQPAVYRGIGNLIAQCDHVGDCFIISSGSEEQIKIFLEKYNLDKYFGTHVWGKKTHWSKVVKLDRIRDLYVNPEIVFIGDTKGDMDEGREAAVKTIAVTWGFHDRKTLEKSKPDVICDSIQELENELLSKKI